VALITTAAPFQPDKGNQGPGASYNGSAKFLSVYSGKTDQEPDLRISHIAYDRDHTSATDIGTYFPLKQAKAYACAGRVRQIVRRFHGVPTRRSQRTTIEVDAPEVVARCREDDVDVAILVANCPVCHQSLALIARRLEVEGIATLIMGCAKDIVEHCGVPRFLFSDFPLGNAAGRPDDLKSQAITMELAFRVLEAAPAPRTTVQSPLRWSDSPAWKSEYAKVRHLGADELKLRRHAFETQKQAARVE
jgi:hypothetical protein